MRVHLDIRSKPGIAQGFRKTKTQGLLKDEARALARLQDIRVERLPPAGRLDLQSQGSASLRIEGPIRSEAAVSLERNECSQCLGTEDTVYWARVEGVVPEANLQLGHFRSPGSLG